MIKTSYRIDGMTCGHCVQHVTEEVSQIPGVEDLNVSLPGSMEITSAEPIDFKLVEDAVHEAGNYTVELA